MGCRQAPHGIWEAARRSLVRLDITIIDNDKLQFYLEEIYDSNCFDKQEMLMWEQQQAATKTNYDLA